MENTIPQDGIPRKQCTGPCKQWFPVTTEFFHRDKSKKDGLRSWCKTCACAWLREDYSKRPSRQKRIRPAHPKTKRPPRTAWYKEYRSRPGVRDREKAYKRGKKAVRYDALFQSQNGVCAICGRPETAKHQNGTIKSLAIDHDHVTGEVRGLLCVKCNTGIGYFHEDPVILQKAIEYLAKFVVQSCSEMA